VRPGRGASFKRSATSASAKRQNHKAAMRELIFHRTGLTAEVAPVADSHAALGRRYRHIFLLF
jgi:hypothetical protein